MSAIKGADIETFTFAMWQIRLYLLCKFNSPEAMVIKYVSNSVIIFCGFRQLKWIYLLFHQSELREFKEN